MGCSTSACGSTCATPAPAKYGCRLDVVLDVERDLVVQPDLTVVLAERADLVTDRIWGAPDLVVEVMSPRPRIGRIEERLDWFATYGVLECWLVHLPGSGVEVVRFDAGVSVCTMFDPPDAIRSSVLPGLKFTPLDVMSRSRYAASTSGSDNSSNPIRGSDGTSP